jgi:acyl carrier protein
MASDNAPNHDPLPGSDSQHDQAGEQPERSGEQIEQWFIQYLSQQLDLSPDQIDVTVPFDDFALDSATAIAMTGDLEDWLGRSVDPTLVYDYPTISDLAEYLAQDKPSADSA